jgi:nicotinamide-nucleotide amidase
LKKLISNRVCILTIGDEILFGQITDTNSAFLASSLSAAGLEVVMKLVAGDTRERILDAFALGFERADILVITGGLGPTSDDLTKPLLAHWFHDRLELRQQALDHLEVLMKKRGREMSEMTRSQAFLPLKAEYLENEIGTAPGMWIQENGKVAVALPGVPYEMKNLVLRQVLPRLQERVGLRPAVHAWFRTVGIPESQLAQKIAGWEKQLPPDLKLAYLPSGGQVKLRLTGQGDDLRETEALVKKEADKLFPLIASDVYAREDMELEEVVCPMMISGGYDFFAEDELSKGRLNSMVLRVPGMEKRIKPVSEAVHCPKGILLRMVPGPEEADHPTQVIELMEVNGGIIRPAEKKLMRIFQQPEINQNMVSLQALNMVRLWILGQKAK